MIYFSAEAQWSKKLWPESSGEKIKNSKVNLEDYLWFSLFLAFKYYTCVLVQSSLVFFMKKDLWCKELLWPLPYNHHRLRAKDFEEVCYFYHSSTQHGSCFVNSLPPSRVLVYPTAGKELRCCEYSWKGTRTRAQSERKREREAAGNLSGNNDEKPDIPYFSM